MKRTDNYCDQFIATIILTFRKLQYIALRILQYIALQYIALQDRFRDS